MGIKNTSQFCDTMITPAGSLVNCVHMRPIEDLNGSSENAQI